MQALTLFSCKRLHLLLLDAYIDQRIGKPQDLIMFLAASIAIFLLYFLNVALGAFASSAVLGDVGEMLVLFTASILFVVAIIKIEADEGKRKSVD